MLESERGRAAGGCDADRPITELLSSESLGRLGALMAVDGEGVLRGVVTVEQVRRALQSAFGSLRPAQVGAPRAGGRLIYIAVSCPLMTY